MCPNFAYYYENPSRSRCSAEFHEDCTQPKYHLNIGSDSHGRQTGLMLEKVEEILFQEKPDYVLVYGDTNSALAGAEGKSADLPGILGAIPLTDIAEGTVKALTPPSLSQPSDRLHRRSPWHES